MRKKKGTVDLCASHSPNMTKFSHRMSSQRNQVIPRRLDLVSGVSIVQSHGGSVNLSPPLDGKSQFEACGFTETLLFARFEMDTQI